MMTYGMTIHAQERLQQRSIPPIVVKLLEEFGSIERCVGAERLTFDKAARRRLSRHLGGERIVEPWLNVYAVVADDGYLVTASHRRRRHRRQ